MERSAALVLYEKVVAALAGVERKGDTMPYTSLNGHMFSVLHKDGSVALRLPPTKREALQCRKNDGPATDPFGTMIGLIENLHFALPEQ